MNKKNKLYELMKPHVKFSSRGCSPLCSFFLTSGCTLADPDKLVDPEFRTVSYTRTSLCKMLFGKAEKPGIS